MTAHSPSGSDGPARDEAPSVLRRSEKAPPAAPLSERDPFGRLGGIELTAAVELGGAEMLVRDLAALGPGSVVRLDRLAGEPADLTVNGRCFARGELVLAGDHLGLRITELTPAGGSATAQDYRPYQESRDQDPSLRSG